MIRLYAANEYGMLVRTGRTFVNLSKALARAKSIPTIVEVRNDALPMSKRLLAIFREGTQIGV